MNFCIYYGAKFLHNENVARLELCRDFVEHMMLILLLITTVMLTPLTLPYLQLSFPSSLGLNKKGIKRQPSTRKQIPQLNAANSTKFSYC